MAEETGSSSMAASVITGLFLFFCVLQSASADPKTQITAHPGDEVTLSCKAPNNTNIAAVKWIRSDLHRYVYLKLDRPLNTADQDPSYVNRVQLKDDEMKNGELSLILKNVTNNDEGTYVCFYVEERGRRERGGQIKLVVHLNVEEPLITAHPGGDVTLSCRAPNNVTIIAVEWIRSNPERLVYGQRGRHVQTADQDPSYVNRVQLKDDEMKNGDLSLILKNVTNNDNGTYECRYLEERGRRKRDDQIKLISIVYLGVEGGDSESGKDKRQHLGVILPVSLIPVLVAVGLVGLVIYKKRKGRSENNSDQPVDDPDAL